jgi:hypothetical protein
MLWPKDALIDELVDILWCERLMRLVVCGQNRQELFGTCGVWHAACGM